METESKKLTAAGDSDRSEGGGSVRAVTRALEIVRLLAEARRSLGVSDLVERTGLPHATVHRLLATLVAEGWVEQSPFSQRYRFGTGILGSAAIALAHAPLLERSRDALIRVAASTGIWTALSVLVERRVTYLAWEPPSKEQALSFRPGVTQPAHCTAAGKLLLAYLPPETVRALFPNTESMRRYTPLTITDPDRLIEGLVEIRESGFSTDEGEFRETLRDFAVPIRGAGGAVIAALSCGGPVHLMSPERRHAIRSELHTSAEEISWQLGRYED